MLWKDVLLISIKLILKYFPLYVLLYLLIYQLGIFLAINLVYAVSQALDYLMRTINRS